jgi:uncharacterized metal-binding protein
MHLVTKNTEFASIPHKKLALSIRIQTTTFTETENRLKFPKVEEIALLNTRHVYKHISNCNKTEPL